MKSIQGKKTLVIGDIHQCIGGYVNKVLQQENDWDHIVFLGDYFDCFEIPDNIDYYSMSKTCEWLNEKFEEFGDRATWLLGNHDCSYVATHIPHTYKLKKNSYYRCPGYTKSKATKFNKRINPEWVKHLELCVEVGGYVLSHAGFHWKQFKPYMSERENIVKLYWEWENNKKHFFNQPLHWIWDRHPYRGGNSNVGSPIWLDWDREFSPLDNIKQIVGHTSNAIFSRECEGNYCIDVYRQCYAIIDENGKLEIKFI